MEEKENIIREVILMQVLDNVQHLRIQLAGAIRDLIQYDFNRLVNLLYTVDIDEARLKRLLVEEENDSALLIADMIIERQTQKLATKQGGGKQEDIPEDERW